MKISDRTLILERLYKDKGNYVTFTKVDGTERKMLCTLNKELIPGNSIPESGISKETSPALESTVRVYDLEKEAWRSFRWDSVIEVQSKL